MVEQVVIRKVSIQMQVRESERHRGIRLKDDLMMELEDHSRISIPDEEAEQWRTIADIFATVKKKLASGSGGAALKVRDRWPCVGRV